MRLLFIIDPLARLNPRKDSTVALMRAAARAGEQVFAAEIHQLAAAEPSGFAVAAAPLKIHQTAVSWYSASVCGEYVAADFDLVFMRKEPPVDARFAMATLLLEKLAAITPVFNAPRALRERNEKLAILDFPQLIPPTIVSADVESLLAFHRRHRGAVIKPLDGMGGRGVYVSPATDRNFRSVVQILGDDGREWLMAQKYLPAARAGDCRVFVINGTPAPWMLQRVPRADDHRGNMAAGGAPVAKPLSAAARVIARTVGPSLATAGVLFAGLDVIGGRLIEINITCPTGLCEVREQTGEDIAETVLAAARARLT